MRWKCQGNPRVGDQQRVPRFAFWPRKVENRWVWLERYVEVREYQKVLRYPCQDAGWFTVAVKLALLCCCVWGCGRAGTPPPPSSGYVKTQGTHFTLDGRPFYFQGTNFYRLGLLDKQTDDQVPTILGQFADRDIRVVRIWGFSCGRAGAMIKSVTGGTIEYDEGALRRLDLVLAEARRSGVKLILALVNYEREYCSMGWWVKQVAGQDDPQLFYRDPQVIEVFRRHVANLLNRVNTLTHVPYRDEPAIMAIELANEPHTADHYEADHQLVPGSLVHRWIDETSRYIRSLDPNHLIASGEEGYKVAPTTPDEPRHAWLSNGQKGADYAGNVALPGIDFATVHAYPDHWRIPPGDLDWFNRHFIENRAALAHGVGKPVILEETGFPYDRPPGYPGADDMLAGLYRAANDADYAGTMVWQLVPPGTEEGDFIYDFTTPLARVVFEQAALMGRRQ
jgi:mannan endo-1,4-beta-mannosidase